METTNKAGSEKKKPVHAAIRKPAFKSNYRTFERQEENSLEGAELQSKREVAAMKFVSLHWEIDQSSFDITPAPGQSFIEAYEELENRVWGNYIFCTPQFVMFRLGKQWVKLTDENVTKASETIAEACEVEPEPYARIALRDARHWAKRVGRVSWILPRLGREVAQ